MSKVKIEYFINGFHQPQLSSSLLEYRNEQEFADKCLFYKGQTGIQFRQSYKYTCVDVIFDKSISALVHYYVYLIPEDDLAKKVFELQYGKREGDYKIHLDPKNPYYGGID